MSWPTRRNRDSVNNYETRLAVDWVKPWLTESYLIPKVLKSANSMTLRLRWTWTWETDWFRFTSPIFGYLVCTWLGLGLCGYGGLMGQWDLDLDLCFTVKGWPLISFNHVVCWAGDRESLWQSWPSSRWRQSWRCVLHQVVRRSTVRVRRKEILAEVTWARKKKLLW